MPVKIHLKVLMFAGYWRTETESVEAKEVDLQLLVQQVVDVEDLMSGDLEKDEGPQLQPQYSLHGHQAPSQGAAF